MIILSWNVRGLNRGHRQNAVHELVRRQGPEVVFLQETKLSIESIQGLNPRLWRSGKCQCIGAHGASEGLACLWNPQKIQPLWWISSKSSMSMIATSLETGDVILLSNIYAPTDFQGKQALWSHIRLIRSMLSFILGSWLEIPMLFVSWLRSGVVLEDWSLQHYCFETISIL